MIEDFDEYFQINKTNHDFGNVPNGPKVYTTFIIKNISTDTCFIESVRSSGGGAYDNNWNRNAIAPNDTSKIEVVYFTERRQGHFNQNINIFTTRGRKSVVIYGNVDKADSTRNIPPAQYSTIKH